MIYLSLEEFLSSFKESSATRRSNSNVKMESSDITSENSNSNSDSSNLTISNKRIRIKLSDFSKASDSRANSDVSDVLSEKSDTIVSGSGSSINLGNLFSGEGLESTNIESQSRTISISGERRNISGNSNSGNRSELRSGVSDEEFYERMFLRSGTSSSRREEWFSMILRARSSRRRTFLTSKILEGKFRITEMGKLEILPDLDISDRSLSEIMRLNWLKN